MGVITLLAALIVIILILGFVTSLQNRSSGRDRRRNPESFEDETNDSAEEKHPTHRHKKSVQHRHKIRHENATAPQQASAYREDYSSSSESHRHRK